MNVLATTLMAGVTCALLSTPGVAAWTDNLPDSAVARWASAAAHALDDAMVRVGANRPAAYIQAVTRAQEAQKFPGAKSD